MAVVVCFRRAVQCVGFFLGEAAHCFTTLVITDPPRCFCFVLTEMQATIVRISSNKVAILIVAKKNFFPPRSNKIFGVGGSREGRSGEGKHLIMHRCEICILRKTEQRLIEVFALEQDTESKFKREMMK